MMVALAGAYSGSGGVNNKSDRHNHHHCHVTAGEGCDDGDGRLMSLRSTQWNTPAKRVLPAKTNAGATARISPPSGPENKVLQGFMVCTWGAGRAERRVQPGVSSYYRNEESAGRCLPGSQVCNPGRPKTAWIENSMLARVCSRFAGWVAVKSAHEL